MKLQTSFVFHLAFCSCPFIVPGCDPRYHVAFSLLKKKSAFLFVIPSPHSKAKGPQLFAHAQGQETVALQKGWGAG